MKTGGYLGDPDITGEHEIDIGLRKCPLRGLFLKGPLPLPELGLVARMPGKALALWLLIRHRTDVSRNGWATLPPRFLNEWGIRQRAKTNALRHLEQAGLIKIEQPKGYMLKVTIRKKRQK
jgi:hypothetical protein